MWLTQRGEEKGKLWGKCYSPPSCPLISQEEKHIKFAVLISIVFKKSNLCNEYLSGRSPAGCWQPGFLDTVWNGGCTFHSLAPSPFFAIYLMSGQRCVCSRSEGRWIPAVLTMLSPAPRGSEPVAGAQQGPCQPGTPPKLRKVPLLPPGAAWLPGVCHPWAPLLGDAGWAAPQARHGWKYKDESNRCFHGWQWPGCGSSWESCPSQSSTRWQGRKRLSGAVLSLHMPGAEGRIRSLEKCPGDTEHRFSSSLHPICLSHHPCVRGGCVPAGSSAQG